MTNAELDVKRAECAVAARKLMVEDALNQMKEYKIQMEAKLRRRLAFMENEYKRECIALKEEECILLNARNFEERKFD